MGSWEVISANETSFATLTNIWRVAFEPNFRGRAVIEEMVTLSSLLPILAAVAAVQGGGQPCGENADAQVLILGAGMAGISAARTLYDNGVTDFIILEQASYSSIKNFSLLCQSSFDSFARELGLPRDLSSYAIIMES